MLPDRVSNPGPLTYESGAARYRLKYCLEGPLNPKQPTNQRVRCPTDCPMWPVENLVEASLYSEIIL